MDFSKLKAKLSGQSGDDYNKKIEGALSSGGFKKDERYWSLTVDKNGVGQATIRFLPEPGDEDMPVVKILEHSFKNKDNNKWYIEKSRATLGEADFATDWSNEHRNSTDPATKELAKSRGPSARYISNILVIKDSANPENEGKVMLFKYGNSIRKMLADAQNPQFDDQSPVNPFDPFDGGANFSLRAVNENNMRTYKNSKFTNNAAIGTDAECEKAWKACHSLAAEVSADKFKDYDTLKKKYIEVCQLGIGTGNTTAPVGSMTTTASKVAASADSTDDDYDKLLEG